MAEVEKILDTVASFRKAVTKVFDFSITESLNHEDSFRMLREHLVMFDTAIPQATEMAATAVAVDKWSKFKSVFVFSPDFMNALLNTEPLPIQIEVFKKLPQNRFFVYYPQVGSLGFFVNVEIETKKQAIINIYNLVECNVNTCQLRGISYGVPVIDGENMKDIFDRVIATGYSLSEKNPYELHLLISNTVFQVLLVLCYLASDNADIVPVKSKKKDRQKGRLGIRLNLNKWDVGYNIAEQLLMASEEEAERQLPQSWHPGAVQSKAPSARFEYRKAGFFRPTSTLKWVHPLLPEGESS